MLGSGPGRRPHPFVRPDGPAQARPPRDHLSQPAPPPTAVSWSAELFAATDTSGGDGYNLKTLTRFPGGGATGRGRM